MIRRHTPVLVVAVVAIIAVACSAGSPAPATPSGPGTAAAATGATPLPVPAGSPPAAMTPSASGSPPIAGGIDPSKLPTLEPGVVCSLLTVDEAAVVLGKALAKSPDGLLFAGLGTNCIYQTADSREPATYIKVEFNTFGFDAQKGLIGSGAQALTVAGLPAVAAEVDPSATTGEARMTVQLSSAPTDPALWIEAPTVAAAQQVAEAVVPRLASVD